METCFLCGVSRNEHDRPEINHVFAREGDSLQAKTAVKGGRDRSTPPMMRDPGKELNRTSALMLNLIAVLTQKGLLNGEDVAQVFGGTIEPTDPH